MEISATPKAELRRWMKDRLKKIAATDEKRSLDLRLAEGLAEFLREHPEITTVLSYAPLFWEPGDRTFLQTVWDAGCTLALPRIQGKEIRFYTVTCEADLTEGPYHIMEPDISCLPGDRTLQPESTVILVPALAFTRDGRRLGKGGGYYDRFLSGVSDIQTVGIAYEFQIVSDLPQEPHDRRVSAILTPKRGYASCALDTPF